MMLDEICIPRNVLEGYIVTAKKEISSAYYPICIFQLAKWGLMEIFDYLEELFAELLMKEVPIGT